MKKTLIALALTALPVAAMADVVLYGQIKGGVGVTGGASVTSTEWDKNTVNGGSTTAHYKSKDKSGTITQMEDYGSRIGFKGEEDLGNGLKAIWQVEQRVSLAGAQVSEGWNTRDTFIGLEGGFGKVRAGYVSDQFNENMETMDIWEYRTGAGAAARGLATMTRFDGRSQGVRYDSPNFGGFDFNITHQMADDAAEGVFRNDNEAKGQSTIVGLNYENSGFFGKVGYGFYKDTAESFDINTRKKTGDKDGHVARVEAGYDANNLFVGLAYQYTKNMPAYAALHGDTVAGVVATQLVNNGTYSNRDAALKAIGGISADKTHEVAVSVAYTMGAITPKLTYAHGWDQKVSMNNGAATFNGVKVDNSGYDQVIIGADYALSKRTTALVSAGWMNSGSTLKSVTTNSKGQVTGAAFEDDDIYSIGVGVRHKF